MCRANEMHEMRLKGFQVDDIRCLKGTAAGGLRAVVHVARHIRCRRSAEEVWFEGVQKGATMN